MSTLIKTANHSIRPEENSATFVAAAPDLVLLLPPTEAGYVFTFALGPAGLSAGTGLSIRPRPIDRILGNGFTSLDAKDAVLAGASDREGDSLTLVGDGVDGWYITAVVGTWTRQA